MLAVVFDIRMDIIFFIEKFQKQLNQRWQVTLAYITLPLSMTPAVLDLSQV